MKNRENFAKLFETLYRTYDKEFGENPTEEQVTGALTTELTKLPKETLVTMLTDLFFEAGRGTASDTLESISNELAEKLNKEEEENAKIKSQNSQNGAGSGNP